MRKSDALIIAMLLLCCGGHPQVSDEQAVRSVVDRFGQALRFVPLLAPTNTVVEAMRLHYGDLVAPTLLAEWIEDPSRAPGRTVSSPWPQRIDIKEIKREAPDRFVVTGEILEVTSAEITGGGVAQRVPVQFTVSMIKDQWLVAEYSGAERELAGGPEGAVGVIREYYEAINRRDFERAFDFWGPGGPASGQTFAEFRDGFSDTASVEVEIGEPGRLEAAAGSRYIDVPVTVTARTTTGEIRRFRGSYALRRSVVDGATPEQRRWHLYSADLRRLK